MAFAANTIAVTATASVAFSTTRAGTLQDPIPFVILNPTGATQTIFIGGPTVTTATGFPIPAGQSFSGSILDSNVPFVIGAGTSTANYILGRQ